MFDVTELNALLWMHLLQVAVVASAAGILLRCLGAKRSKDRPHLTHALWGLVLLKCMTPPVIPSYFGAFAWADRSAYGLSSQTLALGVDSGRVTIGDAGKNGSLDWSSRNVKSSGSGESAQPGVGTSNASSPLPAMLEVHHWPWFWCWLAGSCVVVGCFGIRLAMFWGWIRRCASNQSTDSLEMNSQIQILAEEVASDLNVRARPKVLVLDGAIGPAVIGLLRPMVLLPRSIAVDLDISQLRALLAHELIHFRRGDLYWSVVQVAALAVAWFYPFAWFASKRLGIAAEQCCDEETVASLGMKPKDYALCLVRVLEQKQILRAAPLLPGVRPVEVTAERLERIMRFGQGSRPRCPKWAYGLLVVGALLLLPGIPVSEADETATSNGKELEKGLVYEVQVLEIPSDKMEEFVKDWQCMGRSGSAVYSSASTKNSSSGKVVPAGFVSEASHAIHLSSALEETEIRNLVQAGKSLSAPKMVARQGQKATLWIGSEVPYVANQKPVLDENDQPSGTMQPVVEFLQDGIEFEIEGKLAGNKSDVHCRIRYRHSEVQDMNEFRFQGAQGEYVIQQPEVSANEIKNSIKIPVGETVALSAGVYHRIKQVVDQKVPVLGSLPYIGRLFMNRAAVGEDYSEVILIRCRVADVPASSGEAPEKGEDEVQGPIFDHPVSAALHSRPVVPLGEPLPAATGNLKPRGLASDKD